jgi:hypothetical protein
MTKRLAISIRHILGLATMVLALALCALIPDRALAQDKGDPRADVSKLLQVLDSRGFEALEGRFRILDPPPMACAGAIPTTWYNNVQPYMTVILPGAVEDPVPWEKTKRLLFPSYLFRQDEALLIVGTSPPPMAYFAFQTFLFGRYNPATNALDPATGGFFRPYELTFAYLGDTVNYLTLRTTGATPFNSPMALISTGHRRTQEQIRAALNEAGYPDAVVNTETMPAPLLRFGYENADQFLVLMRVAIAAGGPSAMAAYEQQMSDPNLAPLKVFRVRPKKEFASDPLPVPTLRVKGTGKTEMALYPTMETLRRAILARYDAKFVAEELDTFWPDGPNVFEEGYPAIQRGTSYLGSGQDGSGGFGRDANYRMSSWFDLPADGFALVYGVDHAATGKATYSSAALYLHRTLNAGFASADSASFAASPGTASNFAPGAPDIDKFYVWKIARNCNGEPNCMEAKVPAAKMDACGAKITPDAPVRIGFRSYAEPATKAGPADAELLYERVIVFRPKK